ncbi:MAG: hypothetical protein SNI51_00185 [Rikenellaceae bacterium]
MFINIPNNYSSMWGELIYEYNSTDDTDLVVEIQDDTTDETTGVKKFYSTSSLKLNVAPLLFESMLPEPQPLVTGISTPERGFPKISIIIDSESSLSRRFTYAKEEVEPPLMLSTMPNDRLLAVSECDSISILLPEDGVLTATLEGYTIEGEGSLESISTWVDSSGGAKIVTINGDDYSDSYESLKLSLYCDNTLFEQVNYTLSADEANGYRMAWISSMGSIEHYTFPVVEEVVQLSSGGTTRTLRSAYGTAQELEALSEILFTTTLWRVNATTYTPIELLTTELPLRQDGALRIANFKISDNG